MKNKIDVYVCHVQRNRLLSSVFINNKRLFSLLSLRPPYFKNKGSSNQIIFIIIILLLS